MPSSPRVAVTLAPTIREKPRYLDGKLDDPAGQDHDTVRAIRHQIERHVRTLLADLAIATT
ncbi:hypothetical protein [Nocardia arthritidis]|uniref:hypothetical protein n=1 Tax=Nocardia arthritidis TaxID=228602 RepID=UPI000B31978A